jgi:hypothetical protein
MGIGVECLGIPAVGEVDDLLLVDPVLAEIEQRSGFCGLGVDRHGTTVARA